MNENKISKQKKFLSEKFSFEKTFYRKNFSLLFTGLLINFLHRFYKTFIKQTTIYVIELKHKQTLNNDITTLIELSNNYLYLYNSLKYWNKIVIYKVKSTIFIILFSYLNKCRNRHDLTSLNATFWTLKKNYRGKLFRHNTFTQTQNVRNVLNIFTLKDE